MGASNREVVVFGGVNLDAVNNNIDPQTYTPGKTRWPENGDKILSTIIANGAKTYRGGNGGNNAVAMGVRQLVEKTGLSPRLVSITGDDEYAKRIHDGLDRYGVDNRIRVVKNYPTRVSMIYPHNGDREIQVRPSPDLADYITEEVVAQELAGVEGALIPSAKSMRLTQWVLEHAGDASVHYAPGSNEFYDHGAEILQLGRQRNITTFGGNVEEFQALFNTQNADPRYLAELAAAELAENALCTDGPNGMALARRCLSGQVEVHFEEAKPLPAGIRPETTGAGDATFAGACIGIMNNDPTTSITSFLAAGARDVISYEGAQTYADEMLKYSVPYGGLTNMRSSGQSL